MRGDFGLNVFNSFTEGVLQQAGLVSATASFELRVAQIRDLAKAVDTEMIVYGRLPCMITEQCIIRNSAGRCNCTVPNNLADRRGALFPVLPAFGHRNQIFNAHKLYLADKHEDYETAGLWGVRLMFTTETPHECVAVMQSYQGSDGLPPQRADPRTVLSGRGMIRPGGTTMNWILASGSPRRRELLEMLGVPNLTIRPAKGPERATPGAGPEQTVRELALHKAQEVAQTCAPEDIVIAADTIVYLDGVILGKPKDTADAARMLAALSGREHTVYYRCRRFARRRDAAGGRAHGRALSHADAGGDRALHRHRRADGQGRRLRHSGARGTVRRASGRGLFQRHGPAAVPARTTAERTGSRAALNWKTYLKKKGARIGAVVLAVVLVLALIAGALGGKAGFLTNLDGIVRAPLQKGRDRHGAVAREHLRLHL